jgi:DNA/RNA endonuclease YhcR with UshA esterase domain
MKSRFARLVVGSIWLLAVVPVVAHHSFAAEYDIKKPLSLKGAVTKVEWKNPHAFFYIDVKDETGTVTNWALEMVGATALLRNGWKASTLKIGDEVTVEGSAAKDDSKQGQARVVVLVSTGQRLFAQPGQGTEPGQGAPPGQGTPPAQENRQ